MNEDIGNIYIDAECEQIILARFLSRNEEIYKYPNLKEEHFLHDETRKLFSKMVKSLTENKPFVYRTLADNEEERQFIKSLTEIDSFIPIERYVKSLIDNSDKYNCLSGMKDIIERAKTDKELDVFSELMKISTRDVFEKEDSSNDAMLKELQQKMNNGISGIKTGIYEIDDAISSLQSGRLYVVGARSGMGKSAFMCSIVENIEKEKKVGIVSLEMLAKELKQRIACIRGNIPHWKIEKGKCKNEFDEYATALMSIKNVVINDNGGMNRHQLMATIKQMVIKSGCEIVFVDHIGLIQIDSNGNLAHEIGKTTAMLKSLSKELKIPVVALCQINRASEKENDKMPKLSDLRDSGRIEEDADCVILLYRESYYSKDAPEIENCVYRIAKCRNGKRGEFNGSFVGQIMKFQ